MSFSPESFEKKLKELNMSQQSIQTLSQWVVHNRKHAKTIVEAWHKEVISAKENKKLTLLYLANDIVQNSKRKGVEYAVEFAPFLAEAFENVCKFCDSSVEKAANHVLDIWEKRGIYTAKQIASFRPRSFTPPFTPPMPPQKKARIVEEEFEFEFEELDEGVDDESEGDESSDVMRLMEKMKSLENCPSHDSTIRLEIANLPEEIFSSSSVEKAADDRDELDRIRKDVRHAESLLSRYNRQLNAEVKDRLEMIGMLKASIRHHKAEIGKSEERVVQHKKKMAQMEGVKKQLQSHVDSLPDLSQLPGNSDGLAPLPSVGDLFS